MTATSGRTEASNAPIRPPGAGVASLWCACLKREPSDRIAHSSAGRALVPVPGEVFDVVLYVHATPPVASAVTLPATPAALLKFPEGKRTFTVQEAPGCVVAAMCPHLESVIVTLKVDPLGGGVATGAGGANRD